MKEIDSASMSGLFLYPLEAKGPPKDQDLLTCFTDSVEEIQNQPSKKFSLARTLSIGTRKSKAVSDESDRNEMNRNPLLATEPSLSFGNVTSKRLDKKSGPSHASVAKVAIEARSESDAKPDTNDSRDQVEALHDINDPPGTKSYGANTPQPKLQVNDATSFEVEVVHGQPPNIPEWDYVDPSKKETFQAQSSCHGCTADLIDRVLDDESNEDTITLATLESIVANENDRQLPADERIHDVLMLVGGCLNTFLPEPSERTKYVGASILNLAVDLSEAKFL